MIGNRIPILNHMSDARYESFGAIFVHIACYSGWFYAYCSMRMDYHHAA